MTNPDLNYNQSSNYIHVLFNIVMTVWAMNIRFNSKLFKKAVLGVLGALGIDFVEDVHFLAHPKILHSLRLI